MPIKYEYLLCEKCRAVVRKANAAEQRRRKKAGLPEGGRPPKPLDDRIIKAVIAGKLTIPEAAKKLGVCGNTVRRRLRAYRR